MKLTFLVPPCYDNKQPAERSAGCTRIVYPMINIYELTAAAALRARGVADIIIDPGFGFSKTLEQNYRLLASLSDMARLFGLPLLVGVSRKSMLTKALEIGPEDALNATTVVNTIALMQGASILRVHDARPAAEAVRLVELTFNPSN